MVHRSVRQKCLLLVCSKKHTTYKSTVRVVPTTSKLLSGYVYVIVYRVASWTHL